MKKSALFELLSSPIAYYATLAKIGGGVTAGVFLSQLIYWTGRSKKADGWLWKNADEMEAETGLTRAEQETARRKLRERGFIQERLAGVPATLHYRVDLDAILEAVAQFGKKCESSLAESAKLDSPNLPNLPGEKCQTIQRLPETTTETTQPIPPIGGPTPPVNLAEFFGHEQPEPQPHQTREQILAGNLAAHDAAIARLGSEPWLSWQPGLQPRNGTSKIILQRVGWLIESKTGLFPATKKALTRWAAALEEIYLSAHGDFDQIARGVEAAWNRAPQYRPTGPEGFVGEVQKAATTQPPPVIYTYAPTSWEET